MEICTGLSANKTTSVNYVFFKKLVGGESSYRTATNVQKKLMIAQGKLTTCLCLETDASVNTTNKTVEKSKSDKVGSIPCVCRKHPILNIFPEELWLAVHFERCCEGWDGMTDKRQKSVFACLGWALVTKYLQESVVPSVMWNGKCIRWFLHMAHDLRAVKGQSKAWWEDSEHFPDKVPELEAPAAE